MLGQVLIALRVDLEDQAVRLIDRGNRIGKIPLPPEDLGTLKRLEGVIEKKLRLEPGLSRALTLRSGGSGERFTAGTSAFSADGGGASRGR